MKSDYSMKRGVPYPMGLSMCDGAINIAVYFPHSPKTICGIILHTANHETMRIPFCEDDRIGNLYCVRLEGICVSKFTYQFFIDDIVFCDPYARKIVGREKWGQPLGKETVLWAGFDMETKEYDWGDDQFPCTPYEDSVLYSLHVRGFTKHSSSGTTSKGTFEGVAEKIDYLKQLGITAIECMPDYK